MGPTRPPGALQSMACGASASEGLVFLALWGILQARGREGLAVGASCPAGQGCAGMAGGLRSELAPPLQCPPTSRACPW